MIYLHILYKIPISSGLYRKLGPMISTSSSTVAPSVSFGSHSSFRSVGRLPGARQAAVAHVLGSVEVWRGLEGAISVGRMQNLKDLKEGLESAWRDSKNRAPLCAERLESSGC